MGITSFTFLVFCTVLGLAYFILPHRLQWFLLLLFSLFFYTRSGYAGLIYLLVTAAAAYSAALWMERENTSLKGRLAAADGREAKAQLREQSKSRKRRGFVLFCILVFGIWIAVKYNPMILQLVHAVSPHADLAGARTFFDRLIIPLGISFYTFNAAGYVIDVSRKKYPAERNFLKVLLFLSFFPHIIQGPFSRYDRLGKTLFEQHAFDYDRFCAGASRMLFGFCEKALVADKLSGRVSLTMSHYDSFHGIYLLVAVLGYGIQLYADFRGYMDICCGLCQILGVELEENFRQPYFSVSLRDYWTRWHMTLGNWYTDYVFYPASMGKTAQKIGRKAREAFGPRMGKLLPSYFAMIFVWTLTGLWHGANWTFVIWGWLNFVIIVFSMQAEPLYEAMKKGLHINDQSFPWRLWQMIRTVLVVSFLRIVYCCSTPGDAVRYFRCMLTLENLSAALHPQGLLEQVWSGTTLNLALILLGIVMILVSDICKERQTELRLPAAVRTVGFAALICLAIIGFGGNMKTAGGFMYAQY